MRTDRRSVRMLAGLLAVSLMTPAAHAASAPVRQTGNPLRKLSRGLANSLGGILEIPLTMSEIGEEEGPLAAATWGLFVGTGAAINRTMVGLAEVLTFPFPLPEVGYGPLIEPEFLLEPGDMGGHPPAS